MMANDDKKPKDNRKTKSDPVQKNEAPTAPAKNQTNENPAKDTSPSGAEPSKPEGGETATEKPSNYSRGEGQKPVTKAYKENWNAIFGKKKRR